MVDGLLHLFKRIKIFVLFVNWDYTKLIIKKEVILMEKIMKPVPTRKTKSIGYNG